MGMLFQPNSPGVIESFQLAAGDLVRGVRINGDYLIASQVTLSPKQEVTQKALIQGGARLHIADIGPKTIKGDIVVPLWVDGSGQIIPALQHCLDHAQSPLTALTIDTNYLLSHMFIEGEDGGTARNELLTIDCAVIETLKLEVAGRGSARLTISFVGTVDGRAESDLVSPPDSGLLARAIALPDCTCSNSLGVFRGLAGMDVTITNKIGVHAFISPLNVNNRASQTGTADPQLGRDPAFGPDQATVLVPGETSWSSKVEEFLRLGMETFVTPHGGFGQRDNFVLRFGPLSATFPAVLYKPSEVSLTPAILKRTVQFSSVMQPSSQGSNLFSW